MTEYRCEVCGYTIVGGDNYEPAGGCPICDGDWIVIVESVDASRRREENDT